MSNWMTPSTGFTSWASYERNGNSSPEAYNLLIKNKSNIFSGDFTGTWLLNGDLVNQM